VRRRGPGGFTLLEVMVATAILAMSVVVLLEVVTNNVRITNHAKMLSAATFLARAKMSDIEQAVLDDGFSENDEEDSGAFVDEGFPRIRWRTMIEKIRLPTEGMNEVQGAAANKAQSSNPMDQLQGMMGGLVGAFLEPIRLGLEGSIRRVTLTVEWDEYGRPNQTLDVVTYITDPSRLDMALGAPPPTTGATPTTSTPGGGSSSGPSGGGGGRNGPGGGR